MASQFKRYRKLGDEALSNGEYSKALEYFERAIRLEPKNPVGWTRKAAAEIYLRDYSNAIESCDEALNLNRKSPDAWFNRGLVFDRKQQFEEALKNYDYALRYNPKHIKALNNKGTVLGQLERWDEAKACFHKVLQIDPENKDAKENLSLLSDYRAGKHKSRCFIATAAYGSPIAPELKYLRNWRDEKLLSYSIGEKFVTIYYKISPPIAHIITRSETLKSMVRTALGPLILYLNYKK